MKSEEQIRQAHARFHSLAMSAKRQHDGESYEVCANVATALGWVLDMPSFANCVEQLLRDTRTVARDDN